MKNDLLNAAYMVLTKLSTLTAIQFLVFVSIKMKSAIGKYSSTPAGDKT
jgi:hypothetical protein